MSDTEWVRDVTLSHQQWEWVRDTAANNLDFQDPIDRETMLAIDPDYLLPPVYDCFLERRRTPLNVGDLIGVVKGPQLVLHSARVIAWGYWTDGEDATLSVLAMLSESARRVATSAELAADLGCVLVQRYNLPGMMFVEEEPPRVEIPSLAPCSCAPSLIICYFVALHELGHVANGHTQGRPPFPEKRHYFDNGVLRSEAEAWEWALDVTKVVPSRKDARFMAERYIGSYIQGARIARGRPSRLGNGNRHWIEFTYDDPNNPYVQGIVERLRESHAMELETA